MKVLYRLFLLCLLSVGLLACADGTPDSSATKLIAMSEQATQMAHKEAQEIVLRQVDTDLYSTDFRFVDHTLTKEIMVVIPYPDAPTGKWSTVVNSVSPLLSYAEPAINLQSLRVGPDRVAQAITARWARCKIRNITLYREEDHLTWLAFCNTPEGVVSGSMNSQTGEFQPSNAPPASIPVTGTPVP